MRYYNYKEVTKTMCIIAYKPAGAKFPTKNQFKTMFNNNPDGAGFMYADNNAVHIVKGLMNYQEFTQELSKVKHLVNNPFVFHFRIATHGGVNKGMTQPFPLTDKTKKLRALRIDCDTGIAHNGIISLCNDARDISDTALFIKRYMTRICATKNPFDDINLNIIESCIGSKMAILEASGRCHIIGRGWKTSGDLYFSNDSYIDWFSGSSRKSRKKHSKSYHDFYSLNNQYDIDPIAFCDGHCTTCYNYDQCYGTYTASYDRGINSI